MSLIEAMIKAGWTNTDAHANDLISRQAAIDAICNACGKIDCDKMDKCEKLQLPPANCSEFPNNSDTISRQAAIDALNEQIEQCDKALSSFDISVKDEYAVKVERASLVAYKEQLEFLPFVQPERKAGRWYDIGSLSCRCSACGCKSQKESKFCPNCGADMRERDVDAIKELLIEERKEDKYKIGYADGYHKAESDYYARTAADRDNAFKMGIEVGRGERKTGRWIRHPEQKNIYGGKCVECSECGEKYMVQYIEDEKFCRNCGADMRGEDK